MFEGYYDAIVEWIPYNQFNDIKEINKSKFSAVYSAIWKDGPLQHDEHYEELRRVSNKEVILKYFYNLQNIVNDLLYEAKLYSIERIIPNYTKRDGDYLKIYGISQNPDTKYYILVFNDSYCLKCGEIYTEDRKLNNKWCKPCQMNNLKNRDIIIEWIPYYQFSDIKKISKSDLTEVYSAKWKDGPFQYDKNLGEYLRLPYKEIALKYFYNLQNINDFLFEK
ncbi:kinase-like domain-containing protein [Rhizophagus irregularis DAOM 181602=DAOM 197198]|nr:kinase-like domain-containing protein [Rhizophagus irregularis DAOM 181602=DAOM 197198]